jgi:predicted nucleic acid-binding Zn ribbon protein
VLRRLGLDKELAAQRAVTIWPEVVGAKVAAHTKALAVEDKTLLVAVDGPVWMTQLVFLKAALMRKLCGRVGPGLIADIRFVLK